MEPDIGLANWFFQRAQRTPERRAMTFEGETWTYAQMQRRIDTLAGRLRKLGAGLGTRVAFLGLNQPVFFSPCSRPPGSAPRSYRSTFA